MRVDVRFRFRCCQTAILIIYPQDPEIQKATGKTDPVEVMAKLREMKNNFK